MSLISIVSKQYLEKNAIRGLVTYCLGDRNLQKRKYDVQWGGSGIMPHNPEAAVKSMIDMKNSYKKSDGNQVCHIILSIFCKETNYVHDCTRNPYYIQDMADEVSALLYRMGCQNCYFIHTDSSFPHVHFIIISLKPVTRAVMTGQPWFMEDLLRFLACEYGFLKWEEEIHKIEISEREDV